MLILNIVDVLLQSARKSALLSAAKKAKLKSNPSRVRFAEGVVVNGSPLFAVSMELYKFKLCVFTLNKFVGVIKSKIW